MTIDRVIEKAMPLEVSVVGAVEAFSTVAVRAQVTGELKAVNFRQGDDVKQARCCSRSTIGRWKRRCIKQRRIWSGTRRRPRTQKLSHSEWTISSSVESAPASSATLRERRPSHSMPSWAPIRAAVENAKVQLQYATIRAPISGRTGALMVNAGNLVRANDQTPLVVINQVTPIYVSFGIPETLLPDLRRYMAARTLEVEATPPNETVTPALGHITFVDNAVDQTTGTIRIKATFPNENRRLWPGQFVNVSVRLATDAKAIVVPAVAVQAGPEGQYVYVVKNDQTVEMRPVTVARTAEEKRFSRAA